MSAFQSRLSACLVVLLLNECGGVVIPRKFAEVQPYQEAEVTSPSFAYSWGGSPTGWTLCAMHVGDSDLQSWRAQERRIAGGSRAGCTGTFAPRFARGPPAVHHGRSDRAKLPREKPPLACHRSWLSSFDAPCSIIHRSCAAAPRHHLDQSQRRDSREFRRDRAVGYRE